MHSTIEIHPGGEMSENKNAGEEWCQTRLEQGETNEQCTCCIYVRMHLSLVCFQIIYDYICVTFLFTFTVRLVLQGSSVHLCWSCHVIMVVVFCLCLCLTQVCVYACHLFVLFVIFFFVFFVCSLFNFTQYVLAVLECICV